MSIEENSGANQIIHTVTSTDEISRYKIVEGEDSPYFEIDEISGELTLIVNPDYETKAS